MNYLALITGFLLTQSSLRINLSFLFSMYLSSINLEMVNFSTLSSLVWPNSLKGIEENLEEDFDVGGRKGLDQLESMSLRVQKG